MQNGTEVALGCTANPGWAERPQEDRTSMMLLGKQAKGEQGERRYRLLTGNLVLFVVAISLVPLLITGAIILYQFRDAYQAKVLDHLEVYK